MIIKIIDSPSVRKVVDSIPDHNPVIGILRNVAKALLLRRRLYRGEQLVFEGMEDAIYKPYFALGPCPDKVLVETVCTAVSPGTERGYYLDEPNFHQPRPYIPGYSGCGRVKATGKKVIEIRKGDMTAGILKHSSLNVCGGDSIVPVPAGVQPRDAAFVTLGVIALTGIRAAALTGGEKVGVLGQGILGQMINQMIKIERAGSVTALALGDSKKTMAEKSGVDEFIAIAGSERSLSDFNFDLVIDSTGSLKGFEDALKMVKLGGRVVMLGSIPTYAEKSDWASVVVEKGIEVRGAHVRNLEAEGLSYRDEATQFLNLLAKKKVKLDHLITDIYKPEDAPEIYRRLARGDRGMVGVVIDW